MHKLLLLNCRATLLNDKLDQGSTDFLKIHKPFPNLRHQKGDKARFVLRTYSSKVTMMLTVIWLFLLGPYKLVHISVCSEKTAIIMLTILGVPVQNLVPGIYAPQNYTLFLVVPLVKVM